MTNNSNLMRCYARFATNFTHGKGLYLYDEQKKPYLDFNSGIAVNALGHCHPHLKQTLHKQIDTLWHTSNLYPIAEQERLAQRLCHTSFADKVFFCNSGAEAIEAMFKLARRYHFMQNQPQKWQIISVSGAFHGRTFATMAATQNEAHLHGYGERMPGFLQVPFGDANALRDSISDSTAAVVLETVQGEGGMRPASLRYLEEVRQIADEFGILLLLDEVQCGVGRTGRLWAHQWSDIVPDIMASAKGLGGGFPVGAVLASDNVSVGFTEGSHGSTFGGNPLAMSVGNAVLDIVLGDDFLSHVCAMGEYLWESAESLCAKYPNVFTDHVGCGLMQGLVCGVSAKSFVEAALRRQLLLVSAAHETVRLLPPLIVDEGAIDDAMDILADLAEMAMADDLS